MSQSPSEPLASETAPATGAPLFLVGIGASAGGLESIEAFFDKMPPDTGMAFIVIQHLSPTFKSLMSELLAPRTQMRIQRIEDGLLIEPNTVYLNPPKKEVLIEKGKFVVQDIDERQPVHLPIDIFFRSLAEYSRDRAIAVILSGSGTDGSRGVRTVHESGGYVVVQAVTSAKFDGMPRSAIATGCAHAVLPAEEIAEVVTRYARNGGISALSAAAYDDSSVRAASDGDAPLDIDIEAILGILRERYNLDFTQYKPATVRRRIERRLQIARVPDMKSYEAALRNDQEQVDLLYRDLLIGVTKFFRDYEAYGVLDPELSVRFQNCARSGQTFRAWVAGCATGEEAYSVAILLSEIADRAGIAPNFKIFATDVHLGSLEQASVGTYSRDELAEISPVLLERYFVQQGAQFRVVPELRRSVIFAPHNLIKDPPFTKIDLVSCRNLLIYLLPSAQRRALSSFEFALSPEGLLLLGPSETIADFGTEFELIDSRWKLFVKRRNAPPSMTRLPARAALGARSMPLRQPGPPQDSRLLRAFEQLLQRFVPPSLLVNQNGELLHVFGDATKLLHQPVGRATLNVLDLVEDELRIALGTAMHRVLREKKAATYEGVRISGEDGETMVRLIIDPLASRTNDGYLLLSFEPVRKVSPSASSTSQFQVNEESRELIQELEQELQYTKEHLNAVVEELETSNEELQSTNEELISSNEELQSTNEELHSVNEELYSVNSEFQTKIDELTQLSNDMENLLQSTEVGVLFLDRQLQIRRFTQAIAQSFNLLDQDIGRPIEHISHKILHDGLLSDIQSVLRSSRPLEREVMTHKGAPLLMRALPYRTAAASCDGVVLTFVDISIVKATENELRRSEDRFRSLIEHLEWVFWIGSPDDRELLYVTPAYERMFGRSLAGIYDNPKDWIEVVHAEDVDRVREMYARNPMADYQSEFRIEPQPGSIRWIRARAHPVLDSSGRIQRTVGFWEDITEQKQKEHHLRLTQFAVDRAADAVFWLSEAGRFVYANEAGRALLRITHTDLVGASFDTFHVPDDAAMWYDFWHGRAHRDTLSLESTVVDRTGASKPVELNASRLNVDGVNYVCIIMRDITERNKRFEMLRQMNEVLQKNQDLDDFAHLASHDLKEPLRNIITFSSLLAEDLGADVTDQVKKDLSFITSAAARMQALINDLLTLSRAGRAEMGLAMLPLRDCVKTALEALSLQIAESGCEVRIAELPEVYGDRTMLTQLFQNLIGNALKFRGEDKPQIEITCASQQGALVFGVKDNGVGVRPEHKDVIFQPFRRVASGTRRDGTGIGLAICRKVVERHRGRIWVESEPGQGAHFRFTLGGLEQ
ncbi:MAG: PAS domain S-box protein [Bryobacterales bacterium]|nr:PAS domain S-box protein [Bryobacterales bacterium]